MTTQSGQFAIITGASSGIGLELAKLAAGEGYDLLLAADTSFTTHGAELDGFGVEVEEVGPGCRAPVNPTGRALDPTCAFLRTP